MCIFRVYWTAIYIYFTTQYGLNIKILYLYIKELWNTSKQLEQCWKFHWEYGKNNRGPALLERRRAVQRCFRGKQRSNIAVQRWFFLLWKIDFSALIRKENWIRIDQRAEPALINNFQVMYSAESELNQLWSELIISESAYQRWYSLRLQPWNCPIIRFRRTTKMKFINILRWSKF